jgi:hypothetical protein
MNFRHLTQIAMRKTASSILAAEARLEPTPAEELRKILKDVDIPPHILLEALDILRHRMEQLETDDA